MFLSLTGVVMMDEWDNEHAEQVYTFLRQYHALHGYMPTQPEIADGCRLSTHQVRTALDWLEGRRYIKRQAGTWRGLRLTEKVPASVRDERGLGRLPRPPQSARADF